MKKAMQSTSLDAYKSIDLSRQEKIVLGALATLGSRATNRQIAKYTGWETSTVSGRMNDLFKSGKVIINRKVKDKETNRTVIEWAQNTVENILK